jgi:hypothetical protein
MQFLYGDNLHRACERISQAVFEPRKIEKRDAGRWLNQQINVACGMGIASCEGTKQGRMENARLAQNRYNLVPLHSV